MRNILAMLAAGALAVAGLGWYMGWYHFQSTPSANGHRQINIDVDTKKVAEDVNKEIKQAGKKIDQVLHSSGAQSTPPPVGPQSGRPLNVSPSRFRVEGGVLVDTEGVSSPVPLK